MKKIKVLQIISEMDGGGVCSVLLNYLHNMDLQKFEMDVVAFQSESKQLWEDELISLGIRVFYVTPRPQNYIEHFKDISRIMQAGYDIVHCHMSEWAVFYCAIAGFYRIPIRIGHSHIAECEYGIVKKLILKIANILLKKSCTSYFACGNNAAKYLWGESLYNKKKIYIMHNAVDATRFTYDDDIRISVRKELGINNQTVLGHVGRFCTQKNHSFLVEIFYEYLKWDPEAILVLIGDGELKEEVEQKILKLGIEKSVKMLGKRNDVWRILNAMDAFVLPSLYEGLPVVAIEAQMNGLPLFVSETVTDEVCDLFDCRMHKLQESTKVWCESIYKKISEKKEKCAELRASASNCMRQKGYDITEEARKLEKYYITIVDLK